MEEEKLLLQSEEFERQPVPSTHLKSWKSFLGMYAGEHAAGTEFMIGPLFLAAGVSAFDLIIGLLIGNFLAVLSWRFLTTEIAVKNRLTLYYQLEKISGKKPCHILQFGQWRPVLFPGRGYGYRFCNSSRSAF